jgi:hypothetical protein
MFSLYTIFDLINSNDLILPSSKTKRRLHMYTAAIVLFYIARKIRATKFTYFLKIYYQSSSSSHGPILNDSNVATILTSSCVRHTVIANCRKL